MLAIGSRGGAALGDESAFPSEQYYLAYASRHIAVFTVLGAVAELERSLIVERVKAGLRNAKASDSITSTSVAGFDSI